MSVTERERERERVSEREQKNIRESNKLCVSTKEMEIDTNELAVLLVKTVASINCKPLSHYTLIKHAVCVLLISLYLSSLICVHRDLCFLMCFARNWHLV